MTPELNEGNWVVELAALAHRGEISASAQAHLTELIHTGGKRGISMPEDVFKKLTAEVFTIKFPAVRKKFILTYKAGRAYFSQTEW